jgi:formaldehyde-activating enzyme involved in methanogenesis
MIRERVKHLNLDKVILIEGVLMGIDLEFDMRELFITEHFIKLKCDRQRKLWEYKYLSAEKIIKSLLNDDITTSEEDLSSSELS